LIVPFSCPSNCAPPCYKLSGWFVILSISFATLSESFLSSASPPRVYLSFTFRFSLLFPPYPLLHRISFLTMFVFLFLDVFHAPVSSLARYFPLFSPPQFPGLPAPRPSPSPCLRASQVPNFMPPFCSPAVRGLGPQVLVTPLSPSSSGSPFFRCCPKYLPHYEDPVFLCSLVVLGFDRVRPPFSFFPFILRYCASLFLCRALLAVGTSSVNPEAPLSLALAHPKRPASFSRACPE